MKKLLNKIDDWIGTHIILEDMLHMNVSIILFFIIYIFFKSLLISFLLTVLMGIFKECIDFFIKDSKFDFRDILFGILGSILIYIIILLT